MSESNSNIQLIIIIYLLYQMFFKDEGSLDVDTFV